MNLGYVTQCKKKNWSKEKEPIEPCIYMIYMLKLAKKVFVLLL